MIFVSWGSQGVLRSPFVESRSSVHSLRTMFNTIWAASLRPYSLPPSGYHPTPWPQASPQSVPPTDTSLSAHQSTSWAHASEVKKTRLLVHVMMDQHFMSLLLYYISYKSVLLKSTKHSCFLHWMVTHLQYWELLLLGNTRGPNASWVTCPSAHGETAAQWLVRSLDADSAWPWASNLSLHLTMPMSWGL